MNDTTEKLLAWIQGEPKLAAFLREVAEAPEDEFEYGDDQLAYWIADLVLPENRSRGIIAWERLVAQGVSNARVDELYEELTAGRKDPAGRLEWLGEMDEAAIRKALIGDAA